MSSYLKRIPVTAGALLLGLFLASACGVDHSPMAATEVDHSEMAATAEVTPQPAAKAGKGTKEPTVKSRHSRYSMGD